MKKIILIFGLLIGLSLMRGQMADDSIIKNFYEEDCDACGSSSSGGAFGFGEINEKNTLVLRYLYQQYRTKETIFKDSPWSDEYFQTIQVLGLINILPKFKTMIIVPYHFLERRTSSSHFENNGIGDISLIGLYQLVSPNKTKKITQQLFVGGGLKLPTGKFDQSSTSLNPGLQLGTGSMDYVFLSEFLLNSKRFSVQTLLNYQYKTENNKQFQFGQHYNVNMNFMYNLDINQIKLVPQMGYSLEYNTENIDFGVVQPNSTSALHLWRIGLMMKHKEWSLSLQYFQPIMQQMFNEKVELSNRLGLGFHYNF